MALSCKSNIASYLTTYQGIGDPGPLPLSGAINYGTSSFLHTTQNMTLGTGNFTIEYWFYAADNSTIAGFMGGPYNTGAMNFYVMWCFPGFAGKIQFMRSSVGGASGRLSTNTVRNANTWYHVAIVRLSSVIKIYVNGVLDSPTATWTDNFNPTDFVLGKPYATLNQEYQQPNSKMTRIRISKIARYTANFTPETTEITPDGDDILVMNCSDSGTYRNSIGTPNFTMTNTSTSFTSVVPT